MDLQVSPVFYANSLSNKRYVVNQGGMRCFEGKQIIITDKGDKTIEEIKIGDRVLSNDGKEDSFKRVTETHSGQTNKKIIKITLKNGQTITATEDHEFFFEGGLHSLKCLLSLWDERKRKMEINPRLQSI